MVRRLSRALAIVFHVTVFAVPLLLGVHSAALAQDLSGREIVEKCDAKYAGEDQRTKLSIVLKDKDGNERRNEYLRLWKDYKGKGNVADKMVLFTEYPPDAKGAAFMRWAFTASDEKNADQWIYLPVLKKTRRVSIRDPGDSFLGSDLTYADISGRELGQDEHVLVKIEKRGGEEFYVVESTPKESEPLYSKRVSWFTKTPDLASCVKVGVLYYDIKGNVLKKQSLTWQKISDAWLWKRVEVQNVQTNHSSVFETSEPEVNIGLDDDLFTERTLKRGYRP